MFLASCLVSLHLWEEPSFGLHIPIFRKQKEESGYCLAFSSPPSLLCHVLKAQTILLALHWTPSSLSVLLLELCTSIMTCNSRSWPSTSFAFQEFFKNSCFISCMVAGSHDVAVQKFDSTENLVGRRCTRTSPACNPLSSYLFLLPYSRPRTLPMICVHVMYGGDSNQSWSTGQSVHGCVLPATGARDGVHSVQVHLWPLLTIKLGWLESRIKALGGRYESSHKTNTAETREAVSCLQEVQDSYGKTRSQRRGPSACSHQCEVTGDHRPECHMDSLGPVSRGSTLTVCAYFLPTGFHPAQLERGTGWGHWCFVCVEAKCFCLWLEWPDPCTLCQE